MSDDGRPIPFVLQLVDGGSGALPAGVGVLQLFSDWSALDGPRYRVRTYAKVDHARAAVVVPPRELEPKRVSTIDLVVDGSLPEWGEIVFPLHGSPDERVVAACKALDADVPEAAFEEAAASLVRHPDAWSYVGGYPRSVQSCAGAPGEDFVLQVGSDAHLGLRWDDNGAVYVFWRREAKQFSVLIQAT